ncbi:MAG: SlyX family protein, partial [Pseudomonadota bacterium]
MQTTPDAQVIDQRLTELEIKASFTEDLLEQLDKVIVRQQQQIDLLIREVTELRQPANDGMPGNVR